MLQILLQYVGNIWPYEVCQVKTKDSRCINLYLRLGREVLIYICNCILPGIIIPTLFITHWQTETQASDFRYGKTLAVWKRTKRM